MSKTLWHTIQIKVPKEMVELTKSGKVSVKKTLTKTLNISRSQKTPAIKLIPSDVNKPQIINDGKEWDVNVLKERMAKARAMRKMNANKNIFEPAFKKINPKLESKIITRARELGNIRNAPAIQQILKRLNEVKQFEEYNTDDPTYTNKLNMMIKKYNDFVNLKIEMYLLPLAEQTRTTKERNPILNQIKYAKKLKIK